MPLKKQFFVDKPAAHEGSDLLIEFGQVKLRVLFSIDGYSLEPGHELRILHTVRQIGPHEIDQVVKVWILK
jgi:hypothetical protein